jgi:hypothetical protein
VCIRLLAASLWGTATGKGGERVSGTISPKGLEELWTRESSRINKLNESFNVFRRHDQPLFITKLQVSVRDDDPVIPCAGTFYRVKTTSLRSL